MAVVDSDIVCFCSINMTEDDTTTPNGGGIDDGTTYLLANWATPLASATAIQMVSDNAGDTTQSVTLTGRLSTGAISSDTKTCNGTTPVVFTGTFERVLKVTCATSFAGDVTIEPSGGGTDIAVFGNSTASQGFRRIFYDATSDSGSAKTLYQKIFLKNTNGTTDVSSAAVQVTLASDPTGPNDFLVGLDTALNGTTTSTNRVTAPTGPSFVQPGTDINVPTGTLGSGDAIGVWLRMNLSAGNAAFKDDFVVRLTGASV